MGKQFTLSTRRWADLTLAEVAVLAAGWGYDGLEIAVCGEHLDAWRWDDEDYLAERLEILGRHGLGCWAISNHLTGRAVCDDGAPEGVRRRAAEEMQHTARLAHRLGVDTVVGSTGPFIRQHVALSSPVPAAGIEAGYLDFAARWHPILDVFDLCGVRFAHDPHPSGIASDPGSTRRILDAIWDRKAFGLNWNPGHMLGQGLDPVAFTADFADRIYHVDCSDTRMRTGSGPSAALSTGGQQRRDSDLVSPGRGDVPWEDCFRALARIDYAGPISVEWEDAGMDRSQGAPEALAFLRRFDVGAASGGG